jgi:nucleotide-binding universal stress UspA family protein
LLPIAGSPNEHAAIEYAAVLAIALGASITLVHIDELPSSMVGIVPGASIEGDLAAKRTASTEWLERVAAALVTRGLVGTKTSYLVAPAIATTLVELARREHFDLIVMATHARTGLSRALLGSVAEQVLRHAHCPVLTVRREHDLAT